MELGALHASVVQPAAKATRHVAHRRQRADEAHAAALLVHRFQEREQVRLDVQPARVPGLGRLVLAAHAVERAVDVDAAVLEVYVFPRSVPGAILLVALVLVARASRLVALGVNRVPDFREIRIRALHLLDHGIERSHAVVP